MKDPAIRKIVIHDECVQIAQLLWLMRNGQCCQLDGEVECAPSARLALQPDGPSHHLHESLGDRESQPVQPYLRVIEPSAWGKASKIFSCCTTAMPAPASFTARCRRGSGRIILSSQMDLWAGSPKARPLRCHPLK
jgi:hypothetical protein